MAIHRSAIHKIVQPEPGIKPPQFDIKFVKRSTGEVVNAMNVVCIGTYTKGRSINVKFPNSEEIRNIRTITIIEFNGQPVTFR